jgi:hypothetical protein
MPARSNLLWSGRVRDSDAVGGEALISFSCRLDFYLYGPRLATGWKGAFPNARDEDGT